MRPPRHGNHLRLSPAPKHRAHNRREMDFNSYRYSHSPSGHKKSLSSDRMNSLLRRVGLDERNDYIERKEYGRGVGVIGHDGHYEQRSPAYGKTSRQPRIEAIMSRDYRHPLEWEQGHELSEPVDKYTRGESSLHKNVYLNVHDDSGLVKRDQVIIKRMSPSKLNWKMEQNLLTMEDTNLGGSYLSHPNVRSASYYEETKITLPSSWNVDLPLSERERLKYRDHKTYDELTVEESHVDQQLSKYERLKYRSPLVSEKLTVAESHEDKKQLAFHSREGLYPRHVQFDSRDFRNSTEFIMSARSSSELIGRHGLGSYDFSGNCDEHEPTKHMGLYGYEKMPGDYGIDSDEGNTSVKYYRPGVHSPRNEHGDYFYSKPQTTSNAHEYSLGSLNKRNRSHTEVDCNLEDSESDYRVLPNHISMDTTLERQKNIVGSHLCLRRGSVLEENPTLTRNHASDYMDRGRSIVAIKQDGGCVDAPDPHVEVGGRMPEDYRMLHMDDSRHYSHVSRMRPEYYHGREEKLKFQKEEFASSPVSELKDHRYMDWLQREEPDSYKQADRDRSKYNNDKEIRTINYRTTMPSAYNASTEYDYLNDNDEDNINEDISREDMTRAAIFGHKKIRKSNKSCSKHEAFESDDLLPSQEYFRCNQMHTAGKHNHGTQYMWGSPRHGSLRWNSSRNFDRKNNLHKRLRVLKKNKDYHDDAHKNDDNDQLEERKGPANPPEKSDEFMQLVLDAFLKYSKQLNMKPSIRKRYKGQGKSGSLHCIVCGLSLSKEFMDTQSLVKHALMSLKARAQHLGLFKAVCVMLGWNFIVPREIVRWVPEILPRAEALAQKEDLILWPPLVVVRNVSLSDNSRDNWKVVTTEALEAFLRSKGFIRGSVKVCLGRPGDQSVVVVKFVGTFSGLGDAERIHKYFEQDKRGRVEFEQMANRNRKDKSSCVEINEGEKIEEQVLYGYMGIAEDLEEVDSHTNQSSSIKSKKEIDDWANAPIKPDESSRPFHYQPPT